MQRIAGPLLRWLVIACLSVGLPMQSVSAAIAGVLGARHAHRSPEPAGQAKDPMAGWTDFRRADHGHMPSAIGHAGAHSHEAGVRHHHDAADPSVVVLEAPADREGVPAEIMQASVVFVGSEGMAPIPQPMVLVGDAWQASGAWAFSDAHPRRAERPPRRLG